MIAGMGRGENQSAFTTVQNVVARTEPRQKNPVAVELGRRGGKKGGKVPAAGLSPERRADIGREGSAAPWAKRKG